MIIKIDATDVIILGTLALFGYLGYKGGLFKGILNLWGFYFSLTLSLLFVPWPANFFHYVLELPPTMSVLLGFAVLFALTQLLYVFFMIWINKIVQMTVKDWFNRLTGTLLGLYRGILIISLMALGFSLLPLTDLVRTNETHSMFFRHVRLFTVYNYNFARRLVPGLPGFKDSLKYGYTKVGKTDPYWDRTVVYLP